MKKSKKVAITVSVMLIVLGVCLCIVSCMVMDFDFESMNTVNYTTETYFVNETFNSIFVENSACDVHLIASEDNTCKVVCTETDFISHTVNVENGTLKISEKQSGKKHYFNVSFYNGKTEMLIYLPKSEYDSLYVLCQSGDADAAKGFTFLKAEIITESGDIRFLSDVENDLVLETDSGYIQISDINCENAELKTASGEISLTSLTAKDSIKAESDSADIKLDGCDAKTFLIESSSGNVRGTLLSDKIFITETDCGYVSVPKTTSGGVCEIKTDSGDIAISIEK